MSTTTASHDSAAAVFEAYQLRRTEEIVAQIARLDARLGVGVGATRERARLSARLAEVTRPLAA